MSYSDEVLLDNPLVYWRLGEPSGATVTDDSGNSHPGTYFGTPTLAATGLLTGDADTAVTFGGVSNQRAQSDSTVRAAGTVAAFALECLIDFTGGAGLNAWAALGDPAVVAPDGLYITNDGDSLFLSANLSGGSEDVFTDAPVSHGVHHVVGEFTGTALRIYVDGVLAGENVVSGTLPLTVANSFAAGGYVGTGGVSCDYTIDEAAFYTHALGDYRVAVHAAIAFGDPPPDPPDPPPVDPTVNNLLQVRTVTMDGTEIDVISLASVGDVERTLNVPDAASWSFPKHAYTEAQIPVLGTEAQPVEVQIWTLLEGERDVLLFWGPTVDIQGSGADGAMQCTGAGVDWYLIRRYLDGQRTNLLDNPSFETGDLTSWIDGGAVTSSVTDDGKVLGTKAARLVSSSAGGDIHIHQAVDVTATGVGTLLTVAAWYQVESFTAAAYANRGLYVEGLQSAVVKTTSTVTIDVDTPTDIWRRAETTIWIPPDQTWEIDVRCYSIDGSILWDAVELVAMQSVSTAGLVGTVTGEADLTRIVRQHVLHLQDAAVDKSDVNITTDPDRALIGVTMAKHIQWADHIAWDAQLREFQERGDGIDTAVLYDPDAGTRELYVFHPRRGVDRSGNCALEFPGNISDYRWHRDGTATVTAATWVGDGDGPDREEGCFQDSSSIGGLTLEDVKQAPTGSAISSLEPLAEGEVTVLHDPPKLIDVDIRPDATFVGGDFDGVPLLNGLDPGDWTPLTIDDGYVQESGSIWRIVKLVFHGDTRVLTATLNRDD